ncbi:uncharacterized protein LOC144113370 isoform X1 [Amblyomma americanum]
MEEDSLEMDPGPSSELQLDLGPVSFTVDDYETEESDVDESELYGFQDNADQGAPADSYSQFEESADEKLPGASETYAFQDKAVHGAPADSYSHFEENVCEKPLPGSSSAEAPSRQQECLKAKPSYQELVHINIQELTEALERNRKLQKDLPMLLTHLAVRRKKPKVRKNWYHSLVFHYPYFRDVNGMPAPPNEDELTKRANKELDPYMSPVVPWSANEDRSLVDAVQSNLLQQNMEAVQNRSEVLAERLLTTKDPKQHAELSERKAQLDKEVCDMPDLSLVELLESSTRPVDWLRIEAKDMRSNRTALDCEMHWHHLLDVRLNQDPWTPTEDSRLCELAAKYDEHCWDEVAEELNTGRSAYQCAVRYFRHHAVRFNSGPFSAEEDEQLKTLVSRYRNGKSVNWFEVAHIMNWRSKKQLMNRYQRSLDPQVLHGHWAAEEDMMLLVAVKLYGCDNWSKVATLLPSRTNNQCREHFLNFFEYQVVSGPYIPCEDQTLVELVDKHGQGCWSAVSKDMPWRTPGSVLLRYKRLKQLMEKDEVTVADLQKYYATSGDKVARDRRGMTSAMDRRYDVFRRICRMITTSTQREVALKLCKGEGQNLDREACLRLYQRMRYLFLNGRPLNSELAQAKALNKEIAQYAQPGQRTIAPNLGAYERQEWQAVKNVLHDIYGLERPPGDPEVEEVGTLPAFEEFFCMSVLVVPADYHVGSSHLAPLLSPNETTMATFGRLVDRFADGEHADSWLYLCDGSAFPELCEALDAVNIDSIRCTYCHSRALSEDELCSFASREWAPDLYQHACRRCEQLRDARKKYDLLCGRFLSFFLWPLLVDEQNVIDTVALPPCTHPKRAKSYYTPKKVKKPWVKAAWAKRKRLAAEAAAAMSGNGSQEGGQEERDGDTAIAESSADGAVPSASWGESSLTNGMT